MAKVKTFICSFKENKLHCLPVDDPRSDFVSNPLFPPFRRMPETRLNVSRLATTIPDI